VGLPICSCHGETGSCEVRIVERTWQHSEEVPSQHWLDRRIHEVTFGLLADLLLNIGVVKVVILYTILYSKTT
jgi:hypothetical protein